ncbi:HAD family phosphatase [Clostridium sp. D2Q-14]|uniref:Cof-type HAD-IIB family hydrolase n=1 Tax=Anaeromonas gelatinilytica TaxID=2683194 RepID=UPI00193AEB0C|nr:Cof-type HAD-IIB family hydrolase [Anaeromonas gelatinilytica]MBS4535081.1 HAD family phosphatase [Anaeromonas gelatinilytica]
MEQKQNGRKVNLIALDMDGTLLSDDKTLSAKNKRVLNQAINKGIIIVPATGRPMAGMPKEILKNEDIKYAICSNGAAVVNLREDKVLYSCYLKQEIVIQIIEALRPLDPILDIFAEGRIFTEHRNIKRLNEFLIPDNMIPYIYDTRTCVDDILDLVKVDKLHIEKVNLFFQNLNMRSHVEMKLKSISEVSITSSLNNNLEVNHKNANKGFALRRLAGHLGLYMEEVMACGDSNNDIEMLNAAGLAIAMENGTDAIKCAADAVTLLNEESGVAVAIEKYALLDT